MKRIIPTVLLALVAFGLLAAGCDTSGGTKSQRKNIKEQTKLSNAYAEQLQAAVPYPLADMRDSLERRNLRERLLRFNEPNKIGYVYLLGFNGNYIGYYAIKGKVSAVGSQMTITQQPVNYCCDTPLTVDSMGDDGSYGADEGGGAGILFFTTQGVMVETTMNWIYSDAPLPVNAEKLNSSEGPSSKSKFFTN